jgi:DNA polymerase-3 subunit delta
LVALRGKEIDSFLARPDAGRPIILLYGPDLGLVRERADALMASAVDDPNDPFSLVRLDGDELAAEPSRLVDEAMTVPAPSIPGTIGHLRTTGDLPVMARPSL